VKILAAREVEHPARNFRQPVALGFSFAREGGGFRGQRVERAHLLELERKIVERVADLVRK